MSDWQKDAMENMLLQTDVTPMSPKPMGKGPAGGPWTDEQEKQFQLFMAMNPDVRTWKNKFGSAYGEQPNINDPNFDYREAFINNNTPQPVEGDTVPHWDSRGKSQNHPTEWMNEFMQQFGVDPTKVPQNAWTPEMQAFMKTQINK